MTRTATAGLAMVAGFVVLLGLASTVFVRFDSPGILGAAVGAGLGLANLLIGSWTTPRALKRDMNAAMGMLLGGFFARLILMVVLVFVFQRTESVDAVAFALVFMTFFFAGLGLKVYLVEKNLNGSGRAA